MEEETGSTGPPQQTQRTTLSQEQLSSILAAISNANGAPAHVKTTAAPPFTFRRKGFQYQYDFNCKLIDLLETAARKGAAEAAEEIKLAKERLVERNDTLKIGDESPEPGHLRPASTESLNVPPWMWRHFDLGPLVTSSDQREAPKNRSEERKRSDDSHRIEDVRVDVTSVEQSLTGREKAPKEGESKEEVVRLVETGAAEEVQLERNNNRTNPLHVATGGTLASASHVVNEALRKTNKELVTVTAEAQGTRKNLEERWPMSQAERSEAEAWKSSAPDPNVREQRPWTPSVARSFGTEMTFG
ncbi:unnamed protein product [Caenorhabditis auriculariae]|uniref:Uncharacterized protein n=1 Tax=Caenorhabditis auriculariae TaxID=2777116 RepID=A0A8S1GTN5_9PELO|nr:unnamed protein product [Caenorhabditis auriculariae]